MLFLFRPIWIAFKVQRWILHLCCPSCYMVALSGYFMGFKCHLHVLYDSFVVCFRNGGALLDAFSYRRIRKEWIVMTFVQLVVVVAAVVAIILSLLLGYYCFFSWSLRLFPYGYTCNCCWYNMNMSITIVSKKHKTPSLLPDCFVFCIFGEKTSFWRTGDLHDYACNSCLPRVLLLRNPPTTATKTQG